MVIEALFKDKPQNHWVALWHLASKKTYWFQDVDDLLEKSEEFDDDIYFCLGSTTQKGSVYERIKAKDIEGMCCIHVDIDFGQSGHTKKNLPPDIDTAIEISKTFIVPTFIVNSGHGIHAYYLFKNFQTKNIKWIGEIQKGFQIATNNATKYQIDMTHDVSRILRIPGSYNCKDNQKIQSSTIVDNDHIRYDPEALAKISDTAYKPTRKTPFDRPQQKPLTSDKVTADGKMGKELLYNKTMTDEEKYRELNDQLILDTSRTLDDQVFMDLSEIFPDFLNLFWHRKELPTDNGTCSGYDLAIANYGARFGLSPQELCDLLIMHRVRNNATQMKIAHPYYYGKTIYMALLKAENDAIGREQNRLHNEKIAKAYRQEEQQILSPPPTQQDSNQSSSSQPPPKPPNSINPQDAKVFGAIKIARQMVKNVLGINIHEIIKYPGDPSPTFYAILTPGGREVPLGNFKDGIKNQMNFTATIQAELLGNSSISVNILEKKEWSDILTSICSLVRERHVSDDMFAVGKIKSWVTGFFKSTKVYSSADEFLTDGDYSYCINDDTDIYMNEESFMGWIKAHRINDMKLAEIKIAIMQVGGSVSVLTAQDGTKIPMWKIDAGILS